MLLFHLIVLLKINALDLVGLFIGAFGLLSSILANIVSTIENR